MALSNVSHPRTIGTQPKATAILVVDDNPPFLDLLATWAAEVPTSVITAKDGIEALDTVSRQRPDLIVLDVMMPRMSGFQLCRRLRADASTRGIPILVVTALSEPEAVESARQAGADAVLSKPVSREELLRNIRTLLGDGG